MAILSMSLIRLAEAYERLLFEGELRRRFSHHMAHVASERWLDDVPPVVGSDGGPAGIRS